MITLAAVKGFFSSFKVWGVVVALTLVFTLGYTKGKDKCYSEQLSSISTFIETEAKENAQAVKRAGEAANKLSDVREETHDKLQELDKASESDSCIPTDDQLRILREIGEATARSRDS